MCSSGKFEISGGDHVFIREDWHLWWRPCVHQGRLSSLVETMCSSGKFEISGGDHVFISDV